MNYRYVLSAAVVASTAAISNADVAGLIQTNSYYKSDGNTASDLSSAAYADLDIALMEALAVSSADFSIENVQRDVTRVVDREHLNDGVITDFVDDAFEACEVS